MRHAYRLSVGAVCGRREAKPPPTAVDSSTLPNVWFEVSGSAEPPCDMLRCIRIRVGERFHGPTWSLLRTHPNLVI